MKKLIVILLSLVLLACVGTPFRFENARQVKVGMAEAEVTQLMGPPYMVSTVGDQQIWVWSYAPMIGAPQSVTFIMKDGKVSKFPTIPESFK